MDQKQQFLKKVYIKEITAGNVQDKKVFLLELAKFNADCFLFQNPQACR